MNPQFSIILPSHNRSQIIERAINSVLNQTYTDFELIVVDDGSTDDTRAVVEKIGDPRVKYFYKENEERSIARNFGITKSTGNYINYLDSDDMHYPNHLEVAYHSIIQNDLPAIVHNGHELVTNIGQKLLVRKEWGDSFAHQMLRENLLHGNSIFVRRDIALEYRFLNSPAAIISEDWYVWLRLICRFPVVFNNEVTTSILEHDQRSLRTVDPEKLIQSHELINKALKQDKALADFYGKKIKCFYADQYTFITLILALSKMHRMKTIKYLVKAAKEDIFVIFRRRFLASIKHLILPKLDLD